MTSILHLWRSCCLLGIWPDYDGAEDKLLTILSIWPPGPSWCRNSALHDLWRSPTDEWRVIVGTHRWSELHEALLRRSGLRCEAGGHEQRREESDPNSQPAGSVKHEREGTEQQQVSRREYFPFQWRFRSAPRHRLSCAFHKSLARAQHGPAEATKALGKTRRLLIRDRRVNAINPERRRRALVAVGLIQTVGPVPTITADAEGPARRGHLVCVSALCKHHSLCRVQAELLQYASVLLRHASKL